MVIRTDTCVFSEWKIYPGHGQRFVAKDGRGFTFITKKARTLSIRKVRNQRITWTVSWRRHNKKIKSEDQAKKRRKRAGFVNRDIVGIKQEDIQKLRAEKPEVKKAKAEQAAREIKDRKEKTAQQKQKAATSTGNKKVAKADVKNAAKAQDKKANKAPTTKPANKK